MKRSYLKWQIEGIWINYSFLRLPHLSKCIFILLSFETQLTSDNEFFKYITFKGLSFKIEVLILWESKMGYLDWRTGGLSGDIDEDFEMMDNELSCILHLSVSEACILSSDQYIVSEISVDIEFRKL